MNRTLSIYLDLVRFSAACVVFLIHAGYERITGGALGDLGDYWNDAVMVFFVLSGFVIAFVASTSETTPSNYLCARLSRLWSVVIPALALTVIFDYAGSRWDPRIYDGAWFAADHPLWRVFANAFFVNQLWFLNVRPFSNGPFWSIGYEFWYYIAFAILHFVKSRIRWVGFIICLCVIGPKIALLMPVWFLGVLAYKITTSHAVGERMGWALFLGSIAAYCVFHYFDVPARFSWRTNAWLGPNFAWSSDFASSYVIGALVTVNFIGLAAIQHRAASVLRTFERPIRFLAGYTFSLYLFHYPLLHFFAAVVPFDHSKPVVATMILSATLGTVLIFGTFAERAKKPLRKSLSRWSSRLADTRRIEHPLPPR
jgi:peptidoglycan/LPS O-acetylase OafA/YrhL